MRQWFDAHGWAEASPDLFGFGEPIVSIMQHHFDEVMAGRYNTGMPPTGASNFGGQLVKVTNGWLANDVIRRAVMDAGIAKLAADMLGVGELYLWADSLYWKAPNAGGEQSQIGWHQDKQYWRSSSTDKMITACTALYQAGPRTGGMRFADGSHQWGLVGGSDALSSHENRGAHGIPPLPPGRSWVEVCPELVPGSVTFHHCLTFHSSGPNLSDRPRRSITIHMVAGEGVAVDGNIDAIAKGFPFRGPLHPRLYP